MLMPSILRLLDQSQNQPKMAEKPMAGFSAELAAASERISGLKKIELEIAAAAELVKTPDTGPRLPERPLTGSNFEDLIRSITKLKQSNESRVVDFFE
jgi:hypothetical protein